MPAPAGERKVHAESQRCIHCAKRRWWLIKHALKDAEVTITTILEDDTSHRAIHDDTLDDLAGIVPNFDDLSDLPTSSLIVISRARRRRP